jgi:hypothetical protein
MGLQGNPDDNDFIFHWAGIQPGKLQFNELFYWSGKASFLR